MNTGFVLPRTPSRLARECVIYAISYWSPRRVHFYIGVTNFFISRMGEHFSKLRKGVHHTAALQRLHRRVGHHGCKCKVILRTGLDRGRAELAEKVIINLLHASAQQSSRLKLLNPSIPPLPQYVPAHTKIDLTQALQELVRMENALPLSSYDISDFWRKRRRTVS